jgi:signal transduction histidine kinase
VFKAKRGTALDLEQNKPVFEMYLSSAADIAVLAAAPWWTARHTYWMLGGLGLVLLASLGWGALLRKQVQLRTAQLHAEIDEHKRTEAQLETQIAERKRMQLEIERTHQELVVASRQAGMAEIATGVLHNVGNVLNSVNVSATLLRDRLKQSRLPNLAKAAHLVGQHAADLGHFLATDARGKQLPAYLNQLAQSLSEEQTAALSELNHLNEHVEHIKDIVVAQQGYAKALGVAERVQMHELVEQALRMNHASLARPDIRLIREFQPDLPEIVVDRHQVLQILINLIRNAVYACDQSGRADKQLTLRLALAQDRLRLSLTDNGVGIAAENLTRIFSHGFTTRKDGHGFGLHSGALAAAEMGGTLVAQSDGPGTGATFTLELPASGAGSQPR